MADSFFEQPILNSPYEAPTRHHALDAEGQPLDQPPLEGRRRSEFITPVPKPRKKKGRGQQSLDLGEEDGSAEAQKYNPTPIINEIRTHVTSWRNLPNQTDWGVTPTTARLLNHWRHNQFVSAEVIPRSAVGGRYVERCDCYGATFYVCDWV